MSKLFKFGDFVFSPTKQCVTLGNAVEYLTRDESQVLYYLLAHRDHTSTKEEIYEYLHKAGSSQPKTDWGISVHICKIRKRLERLKPHAGGHIETIFGCGYRINDTAIPLSRRRKK